MLYVAVPVQQPGDAAARGRAAGAAADRRRSTSSRRCGARRSSASVPALVAALALTWVVLGAPRPARARDRRAWRERYARRRFRRGRRRDYGNDEIGIVARVLDRLDARARPAALQRARGRSRAHGGDPRRHDRRRARRQRAGPAAARQRRRAADAAAARTRSKGRHYLEIVRQPDIAAQIGAALRGGSRPTALELTLPARRPRVTLIARSAPVDVATARRGAVLVLHDITDLRRADRIRRDFVANVSHELRTPLTAVRGYVEALLDGGADPAESAALSRDHRAPHAADGAAGPRPAAAGPARRRPGAARARAVLGRARCSAASRPIWPTLLEGAATGRRARDRAPTRRPCTAIRRSCTTRCATCSRTRPTTRPTAARSSWRAARDGDRIVHHRQRTRAPAFRRPTCRGSSSASTASTRRARASERDPGGTGLGLAIVKHLVELHGGRVYARRTARGRRRSSRSSCRRGRLSDRVDCGNLQRAAECAPSIQ